MFRKEMDCGEAGDNCGVLLRGIKKEEVERGMVLCNQAQLPLTLTLRLRFMF